MRNPGGKTPRGHRERYPAYIQLQPSARPPNASCGGGYLHSFIEGIDARAAVPRHLTKPGR